MDCICQLPSYLLGKYLVSYAVVPSLFMPPRHLPNDYETFLETGKVQRRDLICERISVRSPEGHTLDGCQVLYPDATKWVINCHGNGSCYEAAMDSMFDLSQKHKVNVVGINYRNTRFSRGGNPSKFQDLISDGCALVEHLKSKNCDIRAIIGHSLGGGVTLGVAKKYQLPVIVQNTFTSISEMIPYALNDQAAEYLKKAFNSFTHFKELDFQKRVLYATKDLLGSPLELASRVSYFVFSLLENMVTCEFQKAASDLKEILKTIFLCAILTITGALALVTSPFTQIVHEWNAAINLTMRRDDEPLPLQLLRSTRVQWLMHKLVTFTNWDKDNVADWNALNARKIVFYATADKVIPEPVSLAVRVNQNAWRIEGGSHYTLASNTDQYNAFLEDVLK